MKILMVNTTRTTDIAVLFSTSAKLTLRGLVRGESHGGGNQAEKGNDLEGLHGGIGEGVGRVDY